MRVLLHIAYDGTDFAGCPILPGQRTVCGELTAALERLGETPTLVECLSRTDAGVHAAHNLAHVVLGRDWADDTLLHGLAGQLPADLRAFEVERLDGPPTPRAKTYRYTLDVSPWGDPLAARFAWRVTADLDVAVLDELALALVGTHDLEAFRRTGETRDDLTRTLTVASWKREMDVLDFVVTGQGFPFRSVRALVGGMVLVARGGASVLDWHAALRGQAGPITRQTAPARGLCLIDPGVRLDTPATGL